MGAKFKSKALLTCCNYYALWSANLSRIDSRWKKSTTAAQERTSSKIRVNNRAFRSKRSFTKVTTKSSSIKSLNRFPWWFYFFVSASKLLKHNIKEHNLPLVQGVTPEWLLLLPDDLEQLMLHNVDVHCPALPRLHLVFPSHREIPCGKFPIQITFDLVWSRLVRFGLEDLD